MLAEVLNHLHNRFECETLKGTFTVSGGALALDNAQANQYFWVEGSVFNDGLHQYPEMSMADEEFDGKVMLLAIPPAVIALANEIGAWCSQNAKVLESPYTSESFDGYSDSKANGGAAGEATISWQSHFRSRLNTWRKLA